MAAQLVILHPAATKHHEPFIPNITECKETKRRCSRHHLYLPYVVVHTPKTWGTYKVLDIISWESAAALERFKSAL